MSHIHGESSPLPIVRRTAIITPATLIKPVGNLVGELERLKLRDNTVLAFIGDNGTVGGAAKAPKDLVNSNRFLPPVRRFGGREIACENCH